MKKPKAKKASAKKTRVSRPAKRAVAKKAKPKPAKAAAAPATGEKLTFNHAMIYVKDVERGLHFYRDFMGFKLIEDFPMKVRRCTRACGHRAAMAPSLCTWRGRAFPLRAKVCACTSKSAISTAFARSYSKRASTSPKCHA